LGDRIRERGETSVVIDKRESSVFIKRRFGQLTARNDGCRGTEKKAAARKKKDAYGSSIYRPLGGLSIECEMDRAMRGTAWGPK
jgi:hypothetical protein